MQFYPAIKARMGDWNYFIAKMRMKEVANEVLFGSEVHIDYTLDQAIQRTLNESRVKQNLIAYLTGREDRFFASLVVAAIGGSPKFFPVSIADDPRFEMIASALGNSFGVLQFDGAQKYYALDGQHRLKAIKSLVRPDFDSDQQNAPKDFANEEISVLMVVRPSEARDEDWLISYRRLFSSLNRYAKPTDPDTNIIMDEDDAFAILTRRLISDHSFFQARGRHQYWLRVQTKGKNLKEGTSFFTTLQQLYDMNEKLLTTNPRTNAGWGPQDGEVADNIKKFKLFRPSERYLNSLFQELEIYWNAIIETIVDLELEPADARNHSADGAEGETANNLLFWPIGQEVMIDCARSLLDEKLEHPNEPTRAEVLMALEPLGKVDWRLHQAPWRGLLLKNVPAARSRQGRKWSMRNEDRKKAVNCAKKILRWITNSADMPEQYGDELYDEWHSLMILPEEDNPEILWHGVLAMRDRVHS